MNGLTVVGARPESIKAEVVSRTIPAFDARSHCGAVVAAARAMLEEGRPNRGAPYGDGRAAEAILEVVAGVGGGGHA
jgi:UDP-N-acetylglucosamine 2-epimerase